MSDTVFEQDDYFKIDPELHLVGDIGRHWLPRSASSA